MAQRLSSEERARVEAMTSAGVGREGDGLALGQALLHGVSRARPQLRPLRL